MSEVQRCQFNSFTTFESSNERMYYARKDPRLLTGTWRKLRPLRPFPRKCYVGSRRPTVKSVDVKTDQGTDWPSPALTKWFPATKNSLVDNLRIYLYVTRVELKTNFIVIGNLVFSLHAGIIPVGFITI